MRTRKKNAARGVARDQARDWNRPRVHHARASRVSLESRVLLCLYLPISPSLSAEVSRAESSAKLKLSAATARNGTRCIPRVEAAHGDSAIETCTRKLCIYGTRRGDSDAQSSASLSLSLSLSLSPSLPLMRQQRSPAPHTRGAPIP